MKARPIKTEADYAAAMRRIEEVWGVAADTQEGEELEVLVAQAEAYERQHYPIEALTLAEPCQKVLADALLNPPKPNNAAIAAAKRFKREVR